MASFGNYPANYLLFNQQQSKQLAIVMKIEGIPDLFGISDTFTTVRYGDFGLVYGLPGLVYGGLRKISTVKSYIMLDQGMIIQQRIEPEQGKGNIGTLTMTLIDKNGEVSFLLAPGNVVDEIMCSKQVTIYIGFQQSSYPVDYVILYRGYITSIDCPPGLVRFQISDGTMKSRQPIFDTPSTNTTQPLDVDGFLFTVSPANASVGAVYSDGASNQWTVLRAIVSGTQLYTTGPTNTPPPSGTLTLVSGSGNPTITYSARQEITLVPVINSTGFYSQILGPDSTYDPIVHTYLVIDSEIMEYAQTGILDATDFLVTRQSLGSQATTHSLDAQVMNSIQFGLGDTPGAGVNFITLALKLLLSGWDGPCETNISLMSLGYIDLTQMPPPTDFNAFVLSSDDADLDLGLTVGDYFYITGSSNLSNNINGKITGFGVLNGFTLIIFTDQTFNAFESPTNAVAAFRSKYDTLPIAAGSQCRMRDVDVATMEAVRRNYFTTGIYEVALYNDAPVFAKDTIAQDLFLPMGCYQISRYGRISISVTKPPLPGSTGKLVELNANNVISPQTIVVNRSTNNRTFYNQVSYEYGFDVVNQVFTAIQYFIDTNSLNKFNQTLTLPIQAKALTPVLGGGDVAQIRGQALLTRYKNVALLIQLTVNWSVGSLIEVSDIVLLNDNGQLQIMNFETGVRNIGAQLFEVIDRSYNVTQGNVTLKLLGGLGFSVNARFGLISPSTILASGSTSSVLRLTPSYGQTTITNEIAKWTPYFGLPIVVHSPDYSVVGTSTLISQDATDMTALDIDPPLGFTPSAGYILEIANYPSDTNPNTNAKYKALYAYLNAVVSIVSGISTTKFTVGSSDIGKFIVGNIVIVRKPDWSTFSQEVSISVVDTGTNTVTVASALIDQIGNVPFTPDNTYVADGLGFPDGKGFYRFD